MGLWQIARGPLAGTVGKDDPRLPWIPFICVRRQLREGDAREAGQITCSQILRRSFRVAAVCDPEDPAARAVHACCLVTLSGVAPVDRQHRAIGAVGQFHAAEERIAGEQHVAAVVANVAAPLAFEQFLISPPAMKIPGEEMAAVFLGPVVAQIDHQPGVGVAAAEIVGGAIPRLLPAAAGVEMPVVGMHVNEFIGVRIGVERAVPRVMRPGDDLPEVAVDRVDEEAVAEGVPVVAPGVCGAVGEHLEPARSR